MLKKWKGAKYYKYCSKNKCTDLNALKIESKLSRRIFWIDDRKKFEVSKNSADK